MARDRGRPAVFVAAITVPLDDAAFAVTLSWVLRGVRAVYVPVRWGV